MPEDKLELPFMRLIFKSKTIIDIYYVEADKKEVYQHLTVANTKIIFYKAYNTPYPLYFPFYGRLAGLGSISN